MGIGNHGYFFAFLILIACYIVLLDGVILLNFNLEHKFDEIARAQQNGLFCTDVDGANALYFWTVLYIMILINPFLIFLVILLYI